MSPAGPAPTTDAARMAPAITPLEGIDRALVLWAQAEMDGTRDGIADWMASALEGRGLVTWDGDQGKWTDNGRAILTEALEGAAKVLACAPKVDGRRYDDERQRQEDASHIGGMAYETDRDALDRLRPMVGMDKDHYPGEVVNEVRARMAPTSSPVDYRMAWGPGPRTDSIDIRDAIDELCQQARKYGVAPVSVEALDKAPEWYVHVAFPSHIGKSAANPRTAAAAQGRDILPATPPPLVARAVDGARSAFLKNDHEHPLGPVWRSAESAEAFGRVLSEAAPPAWADQVLSAHTAKEVDNAFDLIFDEIQACAPNDFARCDTLLRWLRRPDVVGIVDPELLASTLRILGDWRVEDETT